MRTIILAGGKGTRLWPFTASFPKPLVPLGEIPVLEILLRRLIHAGFVDVTLTLGHLAPLIQGYIEHRRELADILKVRYVIEDKPTGTAGSLSLIDGLDDTFMVTNGDLLTDLDFGALVEYHRKQKAILTIATLRRTVKIDLGVIEFDDDSVVTRYLEKPEQPHHVSMGVYVYEPAVLRYIQHDRYLDFPDLVVRLLAAKERVCTYVADCTWLDIGRPDDYARAQQIVQENPDKFNINDFNSAKHSKLRA